MRNRVPALALLVLSFVSSTSASAQPGEITESLTPPMVTHVEPAAYPAVALERRIEADVGLSLTIDSAGVVIDASVLGVSFLEPDPGADVGSLFEAFGVAAKSASFSFRFTPARRGDTGVLARIRFKYEFRLPSEVATTPVEAAAAPLEAAPSPPPSPPSTNTSAPRVPAQPTGEARGVEVIVEGKRASQRMRESAEAVKVVETARARQESQDLGEVLAREAGVAVRRSGGLGSESRFSLNGLTDDQVRFFLDEVPLEYAGYPFGISNLPVNAVRQVEIYSGVVPVRFGADALGGAVNVVTPPPRDGTHGAASLQLGSYGELRTTVAGQTLDSPSGFFVGASGFWDAAQNDYPIEVEVPNEVGRPEPARVHRFHDDYLARGASLDIGWVRRPWAKRLLLRGFVTDTAQDLQHNAFMTVPYGGVTYGERTLGGNLRYERDFGERWTLDAVAGYAHTRSHLLDVDDCSYDWFGRCVTEGQPGELETGNPRDALGWEHALYARTRLEWEFVPNHKLLLAVSPSFATRTGDDREQESDARDPLEAQRDLLTIVSGLEYTLSVLKQRLENRAFVKQYVQFAYADEEIARDTFVSRDRQTHRYGFGDGLRYRFTDWLYAKASYEWATRLPRADEVFGDNRLVLPYLRLRPERSHNANLGAGVWVRAASGQWRGELTGFYRESDDLIVRLSQDNFQFYRNVFSARSLGVEASAGWTAPGDWLVVDLNGTYQSFRNTSDEGLFAPFEGDRIPNRPWLFANASVRLQRKGAFTARDQIALLGYARYVHEFFRSWESVGLVEYKLTVSGYALLSAGIVYEVASDAAKVTSSIEVLNLTDARVEDFYGVQRPGRTVHAKLTLEY